MKRTIKVKKLTAEAFARYGSFGNILGETGDKLGQPPVEFYRDMVQQDLGGAGIASFSVCRVEERDMVVDVSEVHTFAGEGILPLDGDILIHVAPASPPGESIPLDKVRVFRVPQGTMVTLRPGTWHHAPITPNDQPVNTLIVLPERTYANDCEVVEIAEADQIQIQM